MSLKLLINQAVFLTPTNNKTVKQAKTFGLPPKYLLPMIWQKATSKH